MHRNSRAQKMTLGHRICKVQNNKLRKEKGLIAREVQGHIEHEARRAQGIWNSGALNSRGMQSMRGLGTQDRYDTIAASAHKLPDYLF